MLSAFNEKLVNDMVSNLASAIATLNTEIANIDETYRKLLAEAKESLEAALKETKEQYHYWLVMRGDLPADAPKKTRKSRAKKADEAVEETHAVEGTVDTTEEEEKIIDNLFEENNVDEPEETAEESEPVESTEEAVGEDEFPWTEDTEVEEEAKNEHEESEPSDVINLDEGWPEMPEEWK